MKRLFAALKIHPDKTFLSALNELKHSLRHEKIKWVEEENIHITLKFFGETEEKLIPQINVVLENRAAQTPAFEFSLNGIGIFGSSYAPRILWCVIQPYANLASLMQQIHQDLHQAGFDSERQNLVPHLTLGRIHALKDKQLFQQTIDRYNGISSQPEMFREIILFESILRREGPEYTILKRFPLR